jgi:hypothetical protein
MLFDWSLNHKTLRTIALEIIWSRHTQERESKSERNRNIRMDGWMDGGWVSDLDTTGIFFCIRPQDILNTASDLLSAKR